MLPVSVGVVPGAVTNTIRAVADPDAAILTISGYDVPPTSTVCPALTRDAAVLIVQNGWDAEPGPVFEHNGFELSTYNTGGGDAPAPPRTTSG